MEGASYHITSETQTKQTHDMRANLFVINESVDDVCKISNQKKKMTTKRQ